MKNRPRQMKWKVKSEKWKVGFLITAMLMIGGTARAQLLIKGNVFGGGENAMVTHDVTVNFNGRVVNNVPQDTIKGDLYGGGGFAVINTDNQDTTRVTLNGGVVKGNVYGGGLGRLADPANSITEAKAEVKGPIYVTISDGTTTNVFGCNNINGSPEELVQVNIQGGSVQNVYGGGNTAAYTPNDAKMHSPAVNVLHGTVTGNVYGSGLGQTAAVTANPVVTVGDDVTAHNPSVNGNVYGGGQQAAVNGNTYVNVVKGTLGTDTKPNTDPEIDGLVFGGSEGLPGLENHAVGMVRDTAFVTIGVQNGNNADIALKGSVFGGGDDGQVRETRVVVHSGTIGKALTTAQMVDNLSNPVIIYRGNVYGGGRGIDKYEDPSHVMQYDSEEGRVHGNTSVTINGGKIYHDVYGAGSMASVGTLTGNTYNTGTGKATVTIAGGEIGMSLSDAETAGDRTKAGINSGQVFGSGRGIAGTDFVGFANVDSTVVNITGGQIYGLVFGGGANGHVKSSTVVNMTGGTLGINEVAAYGNTTERWEVHRGNLYGGGRGIDHDGSNHLSNTAGKVYGNTNINISGDAQVYQNVFGGGSIASVGDRNNTATGTTTINISGGTIGVDGNYNGRVFGAGRGEPGIDYADYTYVNNTYVTVSGTAQVNGCVFGSGDNGHTAQDTHVNIDGGTVGSAWTKANNGNVFGGGRGQDTDASGHLSRTAGKVSGNTYVKITGGLVKHQVYGGGHLSMVGEFNYDDEGNITSYKSGGNTNVTVTGGEIGNPIIADDNGHVFGAGRGVAGGAYFKYNYVNHSSVIVKDSIASDNTTLVSRPVINGSVFGGGENGHVYDSTNVTINGGTIGTELTWEHQTTPKDTIITEMTEGVHVNRGNVYGGGRGIEPDENHTHSYTAGWVRNKTRVVINGGKIYHNVYGGGSLASVGLRNDTETLGNTYVVINGGEIGMNNTEATHTFTIPGTTRDTTINYSGINSGYVFGGGRGEVASPSSNEYINLAFVDNTEVTVNPNSGHIYGAVFGGGANGHVAQNTKVNIKGGTIGHEVPQGDQDEMALHPHIIYYGNVYGGGRGIDHNDENALSATAGKVYGNTEVNVSGGTIYHCVYGGGSLANVGVEDDEQTGLAKVTVTGGTIGTTGKNNGSVFGGARGEAGTNFTGLAYVKNTQVVIGQKNGANSALTITGSVFGGGANGHVRENTDVKMYSGTIGTPLTVDEMVEADPVIGHERRHLFRGNVYGGGRGVDHDASGALSSTAGRVYGNTNITIRGGKVYHNVYGGGSLASVGTYTEDPITGVLSFTDNTGHADVTIKAGEIGMTKTDAAAVPGGNEWQAGLNSGQVYGSGRGETGSTYSHFTFTNTTHVTIDSAAFICGAVFGGGANGHVKDSTFVEIKGGTIGVDDIGEHINLYRGNVYGGGRGIDVDNAHGVSATAGQVYGNTRIEISNGYIRHNVFGGGSLASVGTYNDSGECTDGGDATVILSGGQVGVNSEKNGRVYGSGRGYPGTSLTGVDFSNMTYVNNTYVVVEGTADIRGNVFGSGDNGHVINDAHVTMTGGSIGYLNGGFINGNIYGGGRGVDTLVGTQHGQLSLTAGLVKGDTYVNLSGGHVKHNVYGGGYMASVNGNTHIEIGGDVHIGNGADNVHGGMVFGGGRGIERPYEDEGVTHVTSTPAFAKIKGNTNVTITGSNVTIDSTVYGGGRLGAVDGFAYVTVDGATLHYNVFGAGEGVAGNDPFKGDVKCGTVVNLLGGSNISGNVYGGGRNGTVGKPWNGSSKDVATVQVNLGSSSSTDNDIVNGSIFGGGMAAQVNGTATVNVYSGTVTESVYGGNQSNDTVKGNIAVNILGGTLGSQTALNSNQTVDVFGGGYGEDTRTIGDVTVTVNKAGTVAPVIYGDVYGGSALGTVNSDASTSTDKTTVNILNGNLVSKKETVTRGFNVYYGGNVYAGGLGEKGNTTKGAVNGETTVNIGEARPGTSPYTHLDTTFYVGYATIGGNVYGANNTGGSPQKDHTVNIYGTAHTTTDMADYDPATNNGVPATYAIANVFGGGNFADCNISGKTSYVNIFGCDNTIERVFGGGDASASYNVDTDIQGGRMDQVFGGGNGERGPSFAANINGDVELAIHGGKVNTFFVGSNQNGVISGTQTVTVDSNGPCGESMDIDEFFCGGNFEDVIGDVNATIDCHDGMTVRNLYGGCNNADILDDPNTQEKEGNVYLTVKGGTFENVYGGSKGDLAAIGTGHTDHPVVIAGNVNLTITGGTIDTVFGACNINGNVLGGVIINVYDSLNTTCPLVIHNIYGGGRTASYEPTTAGAYPEINIMRGTISQDTINTGTGIVLTGGNVFGGGYGNHWGKEAIVKSNPKITIGDHVAGHSSNVATIRGNVYGGGHGAKVQGDPHIVLDGTSIVNVDGNVFGGGSQAEVEGNPKVEIK